MPAKNQGVTLDELSKGKLPEHLLQSIGELKLTTRELEDWAESQQPFYLGVKDGCLVFHLKFRVKLKKFVASISGLVAGILALVELSIKALPIVKSLLKPP
jgi:hypothetical protein